MFLSLPTLHKIVPLNERDEHDFDSDVWVNSLYDDYAIHYETLPLTISLWELWLSYLFVANSKTLFKYETLYEQMRKNWFLSIPPPIYFNLFFNKGILFSESINTRLSGEDWEEKIENNH